MIKKITIIRASVMFFAFTALTGCFKEDYSFCPPEEPQSNVDLTFRLRGGDVFRDAVASVDIGILDDRGEFMRSVRVDADDISHYEGTRLSLSPGQYRIMFWANVSGNTVIQDIEAPASARVTYPGIPQDATGTLRVGNGDKVWYGPYGPSVRSTDIPGNYYPLTVPEKGIFTDVITFTHAHRSLEIFVKGFSPDFTDLPSVEVRGLPAGLEYSGMEPLRASPLIINSVVDTDLFVQDNTVYARGQMDTFLFDDMDGITIVIKDADGAEIYSIPLADAVEESAADPDMIIIRLVFSFRYGGVDITIPGWGSGETGIGL